MEFLQHIINRHKTTAAVAAIATGTVLLTGGCSGAPEGQKTFFVGATCPTTMEDPTNPEDEPVTLNSGALLAPNASKDLLQRPGEVSIVFSCNNPEGTAEITSPPVLTEYFVDRGTEDEQGVWSINVPLNAMPKISKRPIDSTTAEFVIPGVTAEEVTFEQVS